MKNFMLAAPICLSLFVSPVQSSQSLLEQYGQGIGAAMGTGTSYSLVTWNVYKIKNAGALEDLSKLVEANDFVLTQEFLMSQEQKSLVDNKSMVQWSFAKSFQEAGVWTGVATVSHHQTIKAEALKSPKMEPVTNTPKMALVNQYNLQDGRQLWVVNIHGLNFDLSNSSFKAQIDAIVAKIQEHKGPLIFAGDFNTWNEDRREYLLKNTTQLGLERVPLESPMGFFSKTLDHIFVREVQVTKSEVIKDVQSSDHAPLRIEFIIP